MPVQAPLFIGSDLYRTSKHAPGHPLAIPMVSLCIDLCRALGWLPAAVYRECPQATPAEIARYHAPEYVAAVARAKREQDVTGEVRRRFNLGVNGNPIYREMFARPATACGGSILATRLLQSGGVVYSPAGGTHHGQRDRASGFCTFNDPVLGIFEMLDGGLDRVFYLDVDAHFGDGMQMAFHSDLRVFTLSVHEAGRWPMVRGDGFSDAFGGVYDRAGGAARNMPVPQGFNDTELDFLLEAAILPLIEDFCPQALVLQCGVDALADDPMTKLALSNRALWRVVEAVKLLVPRVLVLGGGGYNPWAVARCWAGVWAMLNGFSVPEQLPADAEALLRAASWNHRLGRAPREAWFSSLADNPRPGPLRPDVRAIARAALDSRR